MGCIRTVLTIIGMMLALAIGYAIYSGLSEIRDQNDGPGSTAVVGNQRDTPVALQPGPGPDGLERARVEWVTDGDTIRVSIGGATESVRLIGIDAPEVGRGHTVADCYSQEASDFLTWLVDGALVWLESDANDRDRYDRLLRYVWLEKGGGYVMVNQQIVANGFAIARQYDDDVKHADQLAASELEAIESGRGIWSACVTAEHLNTPGAPDVWDGRSDLDCGDFSTRVNAQAFYAATGGPANDPYNLDVDRNGLVCHTRPPTEPLS